MNAQSTSDVPVEEANEGQLGDLVQIHGYGNWRAGITDSENEYLYGAEHGRFDSASFSLVLHVTPLRSLRFVAAQEIGLEGLGEELELELDLVFAEWTVTDWFVVQLGAVAFPVGVSTPIYDVGTLRPFLALPQGVYGHTGALGENLIGAQLRLQTAIGSRGRIEVTLFGGAAEFEVDVPFAVYSLGDDASDEEIAALDEDDVEVVPHLVGLAVMFEPGVDGLTLGVSGYIGDDDESKERNAEDNEEGHAVISGYVTYVLDPFKAQAEYLYGDLEGTQVHGAYLELSYALTTSWQIAARSDFARYLLNDVDTDGAESLTEHLDLALGLNYSIGTDFNIKAAYHFVLGNLYAHPEAEDLYAAYRARDLREHTHYGEFGMAFSF